MGEPISAFTNMGATVPGAGDDLVVVDISDTTQAVSGTTKRWEWLDFLRELFATRFGADAGASDTYVVTLTPAPAAYVNGEHYRFKANTVNTGAATVNFNSLGAKTIKKHHDQDLANGDIEAGQWVDVVFDSANDVFQMQSQLGNAPAGGSGGIGDVVGPASATDLAVARFDGTTGKLIQDSATELHDDGSIVMPEMAAPATPAAGKVAIYPKSDGKLYIKDDAGTETDLTSAGGGGGSPGGSDGDLQYRVDASTFGGSPLKRVDANTVKQENGTNAQSFSITKTTTNGYKFTITNSSNAWKLKSESSSGTPDPVHILAGHATKFWSFDMGNILPPDDGVQNLGSFGQKFNQGFVVDFFLGSAGTLAWGSSSTKLKTAGNGILDVQTENTNVGGTVRFVPRTASQITADQNNYSSGGISKYQRWSSDAPRNVTGFVTSPTQVSGQEHVIANVGGNNIVLVNESASSTAANRFTTNTGADITLGANEMALIWYDGTTSKWRAAKL